jgi:hypothetical protein
MRYEIKASVVPCPGLFFLFPISRNDVLSIATIVDAPLMQ